MLGMFFPFHYVLPRLQDDRTHWNQQLPVIAELFSNNKTDQNK